MFPLPVDPGRDPVGPRRHAPVLVKQERRHQFVAPPFPVVHGGDCRAIVETEQVGKAVGGRELVG